MDTQSGEQALGAYPANPPSIDGVVDRHACRRVKDDGSRCRAASLHNAEFCFWHDPEHAAEAVDASRRGGLRRKQELIVAAAYGIPDFASSEAVLRLIEIVAMDSLVLNNTPSRNRLLLAAASALRNQIQVNDSCPDRLIQTADLCSV